jgi:hypothetical protein
VGTELRSPVGDESKFDELKVSELDVKLPPTNVPIDSPPVIVWAWAAPAKARLAMRVSKCSFFILFVSWRLRFGVGWKMGKGQI